MTVKISDILQLLIARRIARLSDYQITRLGKGDNVPTNNQGYDVTEPDGNGETVFVWRAVVSEELYAVCTCIRREDEGVCDHIAVAQDDFLKLESGD